MMIQASYVVSWCGEDLAKLHSFLSTVLPYVRYCSTATCQVLPNCHMSTTGILPHVKYYSTVACQVLLYCLMSIADQLPVVEYLSMATCQGLRRVLTSLLLGRPHPNLHLLWRGCQDQVPNQSHGNRSCTILSCLVTRVASRPPAQPPS